MFPLLALARERGCRGAARSLVERALKRPWVWFLAAQVNAIVCASLFTALVAHSGCNDDLAGVQAAMFCFAFAFPLAGAVTLNVGGMAYVLLGVISCLCGALLCCDFCPLMLMGRKPGKIGCRYAIVSLLHAVGAVGLISLFWCAAAAVSITPVAAATVAYTYECLALASGYSWCLWTLAGCQLLAVCVWIYAARPLRCECVRSGCMRLVEEQQLLWSQEYLQASYEYEVGDGWTDEHGDHYSGGARVFMTPPGGSRRDMTDTLLSPAGDSVVPASIGVLFVNESSDDTIDTDPEARARSQPLLPQ